MKRVKITSPACCCCGKRASFEVSESGLNAYRNGGLIQNCFPELSADDRERFISGLCPECWNKTFEGF